MVCDGLHGGRSDAAVSERPGRGLVAWGTQAQDGSCLPENIEKQVPRQPLAVGAIWWPEAAPTLTTSPRTLGSSRGFYGDEDF
ncbi:hypothetical protein E2C01_097218 [Portunus trituberculatus]|uniref:Uncharacterized protein n=1 Tax=Portunus trituberculatus TaxID=210409 RepID=A0A5B7JXS0_PORTR|nr:hypothetical protein [Portunus trituberculatus]